MLDQNQTQAGPSENPACAPPQQTTGRRPVLDDDKRQKILAILSGGSSRRIAALYVGCSPATITHTARRDPQFADQLARAEQISEIETLRLIRSAARQEKHWRAAAWMLQCRNPEDFGRRPPKCFTLREIDEMFQAGKDLILAAVPACDRQLVRQSLDTLVIALDDQTQRPILRPSTARLAAAEQSPQQDPGQTIHSPTET